MRNFLFLSAMEPLASQVADELSENAEQTRSTIEKFFDHFSLPKLVSAAILLVICIICIKIILRATEKMLKSSKLDKSCHAFIRSSIKIVLVFLAIMLLAGTLGVDTSSLLAILSVAGLAVSLSIQDSLSNLASAVVLLTTRPFKVGDFIEVGGKSGTVRQIGVFHTQIATPDNQLVYLPNSQITSAQITNVTGNALRRIEIVVQASYDAAPDTVKEALVRAAQHPKRVDFEPFARLSGYGDSAISYTLRLWTAGCDYWDVYYDVLENISREFSRSNIEMTYPHINVHMGS